jgi:Protein of unknown function (Hypoth_ymh)
MKAVEIAVREAASLTTAHIGTMLMRKAFDVEEGPLSDRAAEKAERQSRSNLFAGALGSYKNLRSHRDVDLSDPHETIEIILLLFFALRYFLADYGALYLITLGTIAIVVMLKAPRGLWGLIGDGPNIHLFPIQRRVRLGSSSGGTMTSSALREGAALRPNESRLGVTTEK